MGGNGLFNFTGGEISLGENGTLLNLIFVLGQVQQIVQQKLQLQQQIKQFQQQVEQQLAYTQHAGPQLLPPPLQQGQAGGKKEAEQEFLEDSSAITSVSASDLNFLMCADQLQGFMASPGKLRVSSSVHDQC